MLSTEGLSEVKDVGVGAGASGGGSDFDSGLKVVFSARIDAGSPKRLGFFRAASLNLPFPSGLLVLFASSSGFTCFASSLLAPRSCSVGSVSEYSARRLTGSPRVLGFRIAASCSFPLPCF